jgi:DNA-binding NarL/FixJ family response regulator
MKKPSIRVLVADGHPVVRDGITAYLSATHVIEVVGEAEQAVELPLFVECLRPDVLLVDLQLKGSGGIESVSSLLKAHPGLGVVMYSAFADMELVHHAMKAGVRGYVLKGEAPSVLTHAIERVAAGGHYLSESMRARSARVARPKPTLSFRESQLMGQLARGRSAKEIAEALGIRPRTIETHQRNLRRKLHIPSQSLLVKHAVENCHHLALGLRLPA